jgi:hypothetical protein
VCGCELQDRVSESNDANANAAAAEDQDRLRPSKRDGVSVPSVQVQGSTPKIQTLVLAIDT